MFILTSKATGKPYVLNPRHLVDIEPVDEGGSLIRTILDIDGMGRKVVESFQEIRRQPSYSTVFPPVNPPVE